jgi:hypothetical protein
MMTRTLRLWFSTIRSTFTNIGALAVFAGLYALLLATFLRFIWIREATVWQVAVTYTFMLLIPAEFFIFQAAIVDRVRDQKFRWGVILLDALKFLLATIPVLLLGWLIYYLLNKLQLRFPPPAMVTPAVPAGPPKSQPAHWPSLLIGTLRFLLIGITLPLAAIHLWIALAGGEVRGLLAGGAKGLFKTIGTTVARGLGFEAVFIQGLGLIFWLVVPWIILRLSFSPKGYKTAFAVIIGQLLFALVFNFFGWIVTISALTRNATDPLTVPSTDRSAAVALEAAA